MNRFFYQLRDHRSNPDDAAVESLHNNGGRYRQAGYYIFDRRISSDREIAFCDDIGYAQTIVAALNGPFNKN